MAAKPTVAFVCVGIVIFLFVICEGAPVPKHSGEHGHDDHGKDHDGHGKDHDGHGKDHDGHGKDHDDKHKDHDSKEHGKHGDHDSKEHGKHGDHDNKDHGKHGDHGDHDEPKKTRDLIVPTPKEGPPPVIPDLHPPIAPKPVAKPVEHSSVGGPVSPEPRKTRDLIVPTPKEGPPPVIPDLHPPLVPVAKPLTHPELSHDDHPVLAEPRLVPEIKPLTHPELSHDDHPVHAEPEPKNLVVSTPKEGAPPVVHEIPKDAPVAPMPVAPKMPPPPKLIRDEHPAFVDKALIRTTPRVYYDTRRTTPRFTITTKKAPPTPMIPKPPSTAALAHDDHPVHAEPETKNLTLATPKEGPAPKALETKDIPK